MGDGGRATTNSQKAAVAIDRAAWTLHTHVLAPTTPARASAGFVLLSSARGPIHPIDRLNAPLCLCLCSLPGAQSRQTDGRSCNGSRALQSKGGCVPCVQSAPSKEQARVCDRVALWWAHDFLALVLLFRKSHRNSRRL